MYTFLLVLLILDCIVLVVAVLLQSARAAASSAAFGGASSSPDSFIGTRQAGNLLTKTSWWCGGIFLGLASHAPARRRAASRAALGARPEPFAQQPAAPTAPAADERESGGCRCSTAPSTDAPRSNAKPRPHPKPKP